MIQKALRRDNTDLWPQIQDKKFIPFPEVSNCSIILQGMIESHEIVCVSLKQRIMNQN